MEHKIENKEELDESLNSKGLDEVQMMVDVERKERISKLSPEDQNKFTIVERVLGELADAGIPAFLFAGLRHNEDIDEWSALYQYNTLPALLHHDENGNMDEESMLNLSKFTAPSTIPCFIP